MPQGAERQGTQRTQRRDARHADPGRTLAAPAQALVQHRHRHFDDRQQRAHGGKCREHEKQHHDHAPHGHLRKHRRYGVEQQRRPTGRVEAQRKHCRKDRQPRQQRYGQVGQHHGQRRSGNVLLFAKVAAVCRHRAHAQRELEKRQPQSLEDDGAVDLAPIRHEQKLHARRCTRHAQRCSCHHAQQQQQYGHELFGDPFNAPAHAQRQNHPRQQQGRPLPAQRSSRVADQAGKSAFQRMPVLRHQAAARAFGNIGKNPAHHFGVERGQQHRRNQPHGANQPPQATRRELEVHAQRIGMRRAPQADFGNHHRQPHQQRCQQINQQKACAAAAAHLVRKTPDIAQTHGRCQGGCQYPEARGKAFALPCCLTHG